jgi:hypothetical protein
VRELVSVQRSQPRHIGRRAKRLVDDRADALDQAQVDAHRENGRHDVGEEDGGVDVVAADRLERHLRAELGCAGELEERVALAQRPVFRQRPARLAHEPDRRALDRFAPQSTHQQGLRHRASVALAGRTLAAMEISIPRIALAAAERTPSGVCAPRIRAVADPRPR